MTGEKFQRKILLSQFPFYLLDEIFDIPLHLDTSRSLRDTVVVLKRRVNSEILSSRTLLMSSEVDVRLTLGDVTSVVSVLGGTVLIESFPWSETGKNDLRPKEIIR